MLISNSSQTRKRVAVETGLRDLIDNSASATVRILFADDSS